MTTHHRQILLICLGILAASYIVRSAVMGVMQARYIHERQIRAAQQRAKAQAKAKAEAEKKAAETKSGTAISGNASAKAGPAPAPSPQLAGIWHGQAAIEGLGVCGLWLELRPKEGAEGAFTGYTNFSCLPVPGLMAKHDPARAKSALLSRMAPDAAILEGAAKDGSLQLLAQKNIGTDIHGCAITALNVTPFANHIAVEWQACEGGRMILGRAKK